MSKSKKVALITGATGYIGKHVSFLLQKEGWDVHAVVRSTSDISALEIFLQGQISCHYYDDKSDDIINIIREVQPTVVFHLASLFLSQHTFTDIVPLIQSNIIFSTQLVEAMVQNGVYHLINTGTSWQHYNNEEYNPVCLYAATKQAFEDILKYYQDAKGLKVITLKLFDTYGPDDTRPKLFNLLNSIAKTGEKLEMSLGEQYIDLVYIDDVVRAFLLAANYIQENNYSVLGDYAVSSGQPVRLKVLVEKYEKILGEKINILWGGRAYRAREVMYTWNKGKKLLGWECKIDIEKGIKMMMKEEKLTK